MIVRGSQRNELIASGAESVTSYDPATGKELWQTEGLISHAIPTSLIGDDMVFVYAGSHDKRGYAVRPGENTKRILWRHDKGTAYVSSGVLYEGTIYLTTDSGTMTALDAKTGQLKYEGARARPFDVLRLASGIRRQDSDNEPGWREFSNHRRAETRDRRDELGR